MNLSRITDEVLGNMIGAEKFPILAVLQRVVADATLHLEGMPR